MRKKFAIMVVGLVFALTATSAYAQQLNTGTSDSYVTAKFGVGTSATPVRSMTIYAPSGSSVLMFQNAGSGMTLTDGFYFGMDGGLDGYLWNYENRDLYFGTNNNTRMLIHRNGNVLVGTGTATPARRMVIAMPDGSGAGGAMQNADTGYTANDGLYFGIGSAEEAYIYHFENKDLYLGTNNAVRLTVKADGKVGIGTTSPTKALDVAGEAKCTVLNITGGSDLCEHFDVASAPGDEKTAIEPGTVVCIDPNNAGDLIVSAKAYDRTVAGIISGAGGLRPGLMMGQEKALRGEHPVALTGRVYCKADASKAPIVPGDLLTTSDTAGHAMKVTDHSKAPGAILGKAMTPLAGGKGLVLVLVTLQ